MAAVEHRVAKEARAAVRNLVIQNTFRSSCCFSQLSQSLVIKLGSKIKNTLVDHCKGKGSPFFEMCCFHIWALPERGGRVKDGLEHFFPTFARGCKGLSGWFGHFFSTIACLTEGGEGLKLFGQCQYIEQTHFKKGLL